jgi:hypothetical protein
VRIAKGVDVENGDVTRRDENILDHRREQVPWVVVLQASKRAIKDRQFALPYPESRKSGRNERTMTDARM